MKLAATLVALACSLSVASQQIQDVWQTKWDRSNLFSNISPSTGIPFSTPGTAASADIQISDGSVFQQMYGFGGTLTDSSAKLFSQLKSKNSGNYKTLLNDLFNNADGSATAGLAWLRVPLGASDFSDNNYNFQNSQGGSFSIDSAPSYLYDTIADILAINPDIKVHILPWSPPGWMKANGAGTDGMNGGTLNDGNEGDVANYLLQCLKGFKSKNIPVFAISVQNEPENDNGSYPTAKVTPQQEAAVAGTLRGLMNSNGFSSTKLLGWEHNWDGGNLSPPYPEQLMSADSGAFDGVSFHCYGGQYSYMGTFQSKFPSKELFFTECTGETGSDWWSDIKWWMDNLFVGSTQNYASTVALWNIALDGNGAPELPGSSSCNNPTCRGIATINSDGSYTLNQEYYTIAQNSRAVSPKDAGGPYAKRIGVTVNGSLNWSLRVQAYKTGRADSSQPSRWSLVVLNWDDSSSTTFNPVDVKATIEFQGKQATYTFPVGVTTLWWFA